MTSRTETRLALGIIAVLLFVLALAMAGVVGP